VSRFDPASRLARQGLDGPGWVVAPSGLLRVPWRLLLFGGCLLLLHPIADAAIAPLFRLLSRGVGEPVPSYPWTMLAAVTAALVVALRQVDRLPWADCALDAAAWAPRRLAVGALLGTALILATAALLGGLGYLRWVPVPADAFGGAGAAAPLAAWSANALRLLVLLAPAALWEELLFRGYLWSVAEGALGPRIALWSTSVAFGVVHLMNPGAGLRTTVLVVLAGLCLGLVRQRMRSLPAAWTAHLGWNWVMAAVLHVPVSGTPFATPGYRAVVDGPAWLTGGAWGPEGGLAAALVMSAALGAAARGRVRPYVSTWWTPRS
jgi:membrane protease YdiL (CAAX protease family)